MAIVSGRTLKPRMMPLESQRQVDVGFRDGANTLVNDRKLHAFRGEQFHTSADGVGGTLGIGLEHDLERLALGGRGGHLAHEVFEAGLSLTGQALVAFLLLAVVRHNLGRAFVGNDVGRLAGWRDAVEADNLDGVGGAPLL